MVLASMCFEELYGEDSLEGKEMYESVMLLLRSLFKEYTERHGRATGGQTDQATTSNGQSSQCSRELSMITPDVVDDGIGYKRIDRRYKSMLKEIGVKEKRDELDVYLKEEVENPDLMPGIEYDVLSFWRKNCTKFPILSQIAKDVLAMQDLHCESKVVTNEQILEDIEEQEKLKEEEMMAYQEE
ncbi:hypothetical protein Bca101_086238 [Brassica carinata]